MLEAGLGLRAHVPPGEAVGAFNAGIVGYVAGRQVVNLDGVVNAGAWVALREARLGRYMAARRIRYLVDYPAVFGPEPFRYTAGPFLGPEFWRAKRVEVARFDVAGVGWPDRREAVVLLRIDWAR
jgi:hypothetical protein